MDFQLLHLQGVRGAQELHLVDGLLLQDANPLIPVLGELLKLLLVLHFDLVCLLLVLLAEGRFDMMLGSLPDLLNLTERRLCQVVLTVSFPENSVLVAN